MKQILTILLTLVLIPSAVLAGEQTEQTAMDKLIQGYQVNKRAVEPEDRATEIVRLQSQLIDVRVERDRLAEEVLFLKSKIDNMLVTEDVSTECNSTECIPIEQVEQDKIYTHVVYTISQYRLAEMITETASEENVEVHNTARKIMRGAINDLEVLGFDTSNMDEYPSLDEMMEQWNISQGSRAAQ